MDISKREEAVNILRSYSYHVSSTKEIDSVFNLELSKGVVAIPMKIIKKPSLHKENTFDLIPEQIIKKTIEDPAISIPLQYESIKGNIHSKRESLKTSPVKDKEKGNDKDKEKDKMQIPTHTKEQQITEETTANKLIHNKELNKIKQYMDMSFSSRRKEVIPKLEYRHNLSLTDYHVSPSNTNTKTYSNNYNTDHKRDNEMSHSKQSSNYSMYYNTDANYPDPVYSSLKLTKKSKKFPNAKQKQKPYNNTNTNINSNINTKEVANNPDTLASPMNIIKQYKKKTTPNAVVSLNTRKDTNWSRNSNANANLNINDTNKVIDKCINNNTNKESSIRSSDKEKDSIHDSNDTKSNNCFLTFRAQSPNMEEQIKDDINYYDNYQRNNTFPTTNSNDQYDILVNNNENEQLGNHNNRNDRDDKVNGSPTHHDNYSNEIKYNIGNKTNALDISNKEIQIIEAPVSTNSSMVFKPSDRVNGLNSDLSQPRLLPELQIDNCVNSYFIKNDSDSNHNNNNHHNKKVHTHSILIEDEDRLPNYLIKHKTTIPLPIPFLVLSNVTATTFSIISSNAQKENKNSYDNDNRYVDMNILTCREKQFSLSTNDIKKNIPIININKSNPHSKTQSFDKHNIQLQSETFSLISQTKKAEEEDTISTISNDFTPKRHELHFAFERIKDKISNKSSVENFTYLFNSNNNRNTFPYSKDNLNTNSNQNMMHIQKEHIANKSSNRNRNNYSTMTEYIQREYDALMTRYDRNEYNTQQNQTNEGDINHMTKRDYENLLYKKRPVKPLTIYKKSITGLKGINTLTQKELPSKYYLPSTQNRTMNLKLCGHIDTNIIRDNLMCRKCINEYYIKNKKGSINTTKQGQGECTTTKLINKSIKGKGKKQK